MHTSVDGRAALSHIAYGLTDVALVYPAMSGDELGEQLVKSAEKGLPNCFGSTCKVTEVDTKAGAGSAVLGSISAGALSTVLASSSNLTEMIPAMHKLAIDRTPTVFHVSSLGIDSELKQVPGYSDIFKTVHSGFALLHSHSVQECHDIALIAHLAAARASIPIMNFFDGSLTAHEVVKTQLLPYNKLSKLCEHLEDKEVRPDVVPKKRIADIIDDVMVQLRRVLKRRYRLFEYTGSATAEVLVVSLATQSETAALEMAVHQAAAQGKRVGLLKVRMLRPWSARHLLQCLPLGSMKRIAIVTGIDKQAGSILYSDVISSIPTGHSVQVVSTSFSAPVNSDSATTLYAQLSESRVPSKLEFSCEDSANGPALRSDIKKVITWDVEGEAAKNTRAPLDLAHALSEQPNLFVHGVQQQDAYNLGGRVVATHTHVSGAAFAPPSLAASAPADYVVVQDTRLLDMFNVTAQLKDRGTLLLNIPAETQDEFEASLPAMFRKDLCARKIKVFAVNASSFEKVEDVNLPLQLATLLLAGLLGQASLAAATELVQSGLSSTLAGLYQLDAGFVRDLVEQVGKAVRPVNIPEAWIAEIVAAPVAKEGEEAPAAPVALPTHIVAPSFARNLPPPVAAKKADLSPWNSAALRLMFPEAYSTEHKHRPLDSAKEASFVCKVQKNIRLTPTTYDRNVFHIEFDITGTGLKYEIGDALGVWARNRACDVNDFLAFYGFEAQDSVSMLDASGNAIVRSVEQVLTQQLDMFGRPSRRFYESLAAYAEDPKEKARLEFLAGKDGGFEFKKLVEQTVTFADILKMFKSAHPSMTELLALIPGIKPRHYSIASAQSMHANSVHLLVVLVQWETPDGKQRFGQATKYLVDLPEGAEISVCVKPSVMKLPEDDAAPVIMAGLGTGMAPFRAFIQERAWRQQQGKKVGPMSLYFGSRSMFKEYLYGDELEAYHASGLLTNLRCAFSRDNPKTKSYIQHKIAEDARQLYQYLGETKGTFYLCGPTWPAGDVQDAITSAYERFGHLSAADAAHEISELKEHERYILEVY